ncbi:MAG: AI-2E family transporter [Deltaproteobacteria bacterium]|nr:AI-2E family transporter [Deltaproteobacteria bacterium]
MRQETIHKAVLLLIVLFISAVFFSMISQFLMAILLGGIFSALAHPIYRRFEGWLGGRRQFASLATLFLIVILVLLPLTGILAIVAAQAISVGQSVTPWVQEQISQPTAFSDILTHIPFYDRIEPYQGAILTKAGQLVGHISRFLLDSLSSVTRSTINFLFSLVILLYTMFFFLMDGDKLLQKVMYYLPLEEKDERRLLDKFTSVTRATLKGTALIGILQGGLAGIAFAVVGINSALFWGTIMTILSIIPAVGSALVWVPAAIILAAGGQFAKAVGLALFCALVVGSMDNFLRPRLIGKDTAMHELLVLFGTLGGIFMFGIVGFIIGPIIAALFVTVWEIYGTVFKDILPEVSNVYPEKKTQRPVSLPDQQEKGES